MPQRRHLEDDQAVALIQWRDTYVRKYPELGLLIAIPNGGKRNAREGARLKRMGVRAGVSDYFLPVPRFNAGGTIPNTVLQWDCGLWLELKAAKNKATREQGQWLALMRGQYYAGIVCTGWVAAARAICDYLGLTGSVRP